MKKSLLLLAFALFPLISCNNGGSSDPTKPATEEVTLTKNNYKTYIATRTSIDVVAVTSNYHYIYHTYFEGADFCRFKDCRITGYYDSIEVTQSIYLTISGDGETEYYESQTRGKTFKITACSGTVTVYM